MKGRLKRFALGCALLLCLSIFQEPIKAGLVKVSTIIGHQVSNSLEQAFEESQAKTA